MANQWNALTALGHDTAEVVQIGPYRIAERFDVALASLAIRRGQDKAFAAAAKKAGVPLPGASTHEAGKVFGAFWATPEMWFVEADFATCRCASIRKPARCASFGMCRDNCSISSAAGRSR